MWLGVTAGLTLLTWFIALSPVFASQVTFTDQQLNYSGSGWQTAQSPSACSQVSQTMHTTSTTGDVVSFSFIGTGIIIRGPSTNTSLPNVVVIDQAVQPLAVPIKTNCGNGCGIIYANGNVTDTPHTISIMFTFPNGTATLAICGVSVLNGTLIPLIPQNPTAPAGVPFNPTITIANPTSTSSIVATSFASTTIAPIIFAVVGVIIVMTAALVIFVIIRRRVTRNAARRRDQDNGCQRREIEEGKCPLADKDVPTILTPSSLKDTIAISSAVSSPVRDRFSITTSPLSAPIASGSGNQSQLFARVSATQRLPSTIQTDRWSLMTPVALGLSVGTPTEPDDSSVFSMHIENASLVPPISGRAASQLSIPIGLYSRDHRPASTATTLSPAGLTTPSLVSRSSYYSSSTNSPTTYRSRASRIEIFPRKRDGSLRSGWQRLDGKESGSTGSASRRSLRTDLPMDLF